MRAERLIALLMKLEKGSGASASELAKALGVSTRTILRDVEALSLLGVPVYAERGRTGGVRLLAHYRSELNGLSVVDVESMALVAGPAPLLQDRNGPGVRSVRSMLDKLSAAVPAIHRQSAERARARLHFDTRPWFRQPDESPYLDQLRQFVWADQCVRITYLRADGEVRDYVLEPLALVIKVDIWYLVAKKRASEKRGKQGVRAKQTTGLRVFRLSRLRCVSEYPETFERDAGFDLVRFWEQWCARFEAIPPTQYPVRLAVGKAGLDALVRAGIHDDRNLDRLPNSGQTRLEVEVDLESPEHAVGLLFPLGDRVEVLSPRPLRRALHQLAARVLKASA